jgi:hypothetical protein
MTLVLGYSERDFCVVGTDLLKRLIYGSDQWLESKFIPAGPRNEFYLAFSGFVPNDKVKTLYSLPLVDLMNGNYESIKHKDFPLPNLLVGVPEETKLYYAGAPDPISLTHLHTDELFSMGIIDTDIEYRRRLKKAFLGRQPTPEEVAEEMERIILDAERENPGVLEGAETYIIAGGNVTRFSSTIGSDR